jgi:polysaccharide export outer membrane protein
MSKLIWLWLKIVTTSALLAGCSVLPAFGPSDDAVIADAQNPTVEEAPPLAYDLVDISPLNLADYATRHRHSFHGSFVGSAPIATGNRLATGDVLQIIVWEPTDDGLFATTGKRAEDLTVVVDTSGKISLPYVDEISVRGRTIAQVRAHLATLYSRQAINPEVQVRVVASDANSVSILGDIGKAGRLALPLRGARLIDLIAQAGGIALPSWEVFVSVTRKRQVQTVRYDDILAKTGNNVAIRPDDIIQITHQPRLFSVFGAVKDSGRFEIDKPVPTVLDVLGAAGGLDDKQAEPQSIFIYRPVAALGSGTSTVYRFDLRRSDAFFLGGAFTLKDGDVTYVATADSSNLQKLWAVVFAPLRSVSN